MLAMALYLALWGVAFAVAAAGPWLIHHAVSRRRMTIREKKAISERPSYLSEAMAGRAMVAFLEKHASNGSVAYIASGNGLYPSNVDYLSPGRKSIYFDAITNLANKGTSIFFVFTHYSSEAEASWKDLKISKENKGSINFVKVDCDVDSELRRVVDALETFHPSIIVNDKDGKKGAIWLEKYHAANSGIARNVECFEGEKLNKSLDSSLEGYKKMFENIVRQSKVSPAAHS
jgi:hypothetical protein